MSWLIIFASLVISVFCAPIDNDQVDLVEFKIVGGVETTIEQHPYQVSLQYNGRHFCAGSIISPNTILTAAHCTQTSYIRNSMDVRAGSTYRIGGGGQLIRVARIIDHPNYDTKNHDHDISILILSKPLSMNRSVQRVNLETARTIPEGKRAVVTGWGHTQENGQLSMKLRKVYVPIMSDANCRRSYGNRISPTMVCAGEIYGTKDACQADSGGPLVLDNKLIGVVSWGIGCAKAGYPGVYTNVGLLNSWIVKNTKP